MARQFRAGPAEEPAQGDWGVGFRLGRFSSRMSVLGGGCSRSSLHMTLLNWLYKVIVHSSLHFVVLKVNKKCKVKMSAHTSMGNMKNRTSRSIAQRRNSNQFLKKGTYSRGVSPKP